MHARRTLLFAALSFIATAAHAQTLADAQTCDSAIEGSLAHRATIARYVAATTSPLHEFGAGCMAAISNQPDSAIAHFEAATRANPRSSAAFLWLGNALGQQAKAGNLPMKMRLAPKIRDAYSQAVTLDGSNIDAREGLMQFHMQAPAMMGGEKAKAREQADAIFALNPFRGLSAQITVASSSGDKPAVERYLSQATTQFPDSVLGWANLVAVQADAMRGSDAFATIARWEARQTNPMYRLFAIGRTAAVTGQQLDRGVQALQQYLRGRRTPNDPPFANANLRLGQIYERQNKKSQARAAFETALATNPNLRDAQLGLERVK